MFAYSVPQPCKMVCCNILLVHVLVKDCLPPQAAQLRHQICTSCQTMQIVLEGTSCYIASQAVVHLHPCNYLMHGPLSQHNMVYDLVPDPCGNLDDQPEYLIQNNTHSLTHLSLTHSPLSHSLTHSLTHSRTHALTHLLTHTLAHSSTYSFIPPPLHPLTP